MKPPPRGCIGQHSEDDDCHNVGRYVCPQHFSEVLASFMGYVTVDQSHQALHCLHDLTVHGWIDQAVYTMCGFLEMFAGNRGDAREQVAAGVHDDLSGMPEDARERFGVWVPYLARLTRCAIFGNGPGIGDVLEDMTRDPRMHGEATTSVISSLAAAAHTAIHARDDCTTDTVAAMMMVGSQVYDPQGYSLLAPLVAMIDSMGVKGETDPDRRYRDRLFAAELDEIVSAAGTIGRTLGQMVTQSGGGPTVILLSQETGDPLVDMSGTLNWQNESLDAGRSRSELMMARAVRIGHLFGQDRKEDALAAISRDPDPAHRLEYLLDVLSGGAGVIGMMIRYRGAMSEMTPPAAP